MANDEWRTDPRVLNFVKDRKACEIILDVATNGYNSVAPYFITKEQNSLIFDWYGLFVNLSLCCEQIAWMNPPFSRGNLPEFTKKAYHEGQKGLNLAGIVPLDCTQWAREWVWGKAEVWIPDERICYINPDTGKAEKSPEKPSMLIFYGPFSRPNHVESVTIPKEV